MNSVITYGKYQSEYRNKKVDRWLSNDIPSYRFVLIIENETGNRP